MQQVIYPNLSSISHILSINLPGDLLNPHPSPWPQLAGISRPMMCAAVSGPE